MPTLTKADLVDLIYLHRELRYVFTKKEAKVLIDSLFEEVKTSLTSGETVKLAGFGNFELREKSERPGRNPRTGEAKTVSARNVVTFHPSQKLKELINTQSKRNLERRREKNLLK